MNAGRRNHRDDSTIPVPRLPCDVPTVPIWRMSVEDYHQMSQTAILRDGDPIELLQGWLVPKMKKSPRHVFIASQLERCIRELLPNDWSLFPQSPITLDDSEPEPDFAIVRGTSRDYRDRHPGAADVALVIEVSHATLELDRGLKLQVYASAGIAEYWIANIPDQQMEVYTVPLPPARSLPTSGTEEIETSFGYPSSDSSTPLPDFKSRRDYAPGDLIPLRLNRCLRGQIPVESIFPFQSRSSQ